MNSNNRALWTAAVTLVLVAVVEFAIGFSIGKELANNGLPDCQEDEFLYPIDYAGPGDNITTDYECNHIDNYPWPKPNGDKVVIYND